MKKCHFLRKKIPAGPDRPRLLGELHRELEAVREHQFAEVWVDYCDYPALCALVNGDRAWLLYIREDGDASFSSRDPHYSGREDAEMDFYLSNGQKDRYPVAWTIPTSAAFRALEYFAAEKRAPDWVSWLNDSGDGAAGPNRA